MDSDSKSIGANTNAPAEVVLPDCVLFAGEDASSTEQTMLRSFGPIQQQHSFRGYVLQRRREVTTIFSGMGTGCVEALIWELNTSGRARRLILAGTAGLMPRARVSVGQAYVVRSARPSGSGIETLGIGNDFTPRWPHLNEIATATIASTEFYYGFSEKASQAGHPYAPTRLAKLFADSDADMVDMESASFYALCRLIMPESAQFVAIKSPVNPAGEAQEQHLGNAPGALEQCAIAAARLLKSDLDLRSKRSC